MCPSIASAHVSTAYNGSIYNTGRHLQLNEDMLKIAPTVGEAVATIFLAGLSIVLQSNRLGGEVLPFVL